MLAHRQLEEAVTLIQEAQGCIHQLEKDNTRILPSVRDHLASAIADIDKSCEPPRRSLPQSGRSPTTDLAGDVLGLLSLLLHQMNETSRRLETLNSGHERPVYHLKQQNLKSIAACLGDLRRLTNRLEAEIRLLHLRV